MTHPGYSFQPFAAEPANPERACLRILATTDLHMHLRGHNYFADREDPTTGLTRTATLIRQARKEALDRGDFVLLLDNGDSLQGPTQSDADDWRGRGHPMMQAFAALEYNAIGLGNHDFDAGLPTLFNILNAAPFPVLCSNVSGKTGPLRKSAVFAFRGPQARSLKVGLLSVLPPQTVQWNAHLLAGDITVSDMTETTAAIAQSLKTVGCDLVVALAHSGLSDESDQRFAENVVTQIAAIDAVDAVIAGHTHLRLPGPDHAGLDGVDTETGMVHGTPVVMPGSAGSHLGVIDLSLVDQGAAWKPVAADVSLRAIAARSPSGAVNAHASEDPALSNLLALHHETAQADLQEVIGATSKHLHSFFTRFGPDHALVAVAEAQAAAAAAALGAAGSPDLPILSAVAPAKTGGFGGPDFFTHVPKGPISLRHLADLNMFNDQIRIVRLTGAEIVDWLEMSASQFRQIDANRHNPELVDPATPGYFFDVLHGLSYEIDPTAPARFDRLGQCVAPEARRVRRVRFAGAALNPEDPFYVVVSSYRLNGGGNFSALRNAPEISMAACDIRTALRAYFQGATSGPSYAPPWRLAHAPGASVCVGTSPEARAHLHEIADLSPQDLGVDRSGFLRLRLSL